MDPHIANNVADVIHSKLESLESVPQDSTWDLNNLHLALLFDELPGNSDRVCSTQVTKSRTRSSAMR